MPIVALVSGYKIMIFFNDHGRPHVHIQLADRSAVVEISTLVISHNHGIGGRDMRMLLKFIKERKGELLEKWEASKTKA